MDPSKRTCCAVVLLADELVRPRFGRTPMGTNAEARLPSSADKGGNCQSEELLDL